ncbi:unnamed protein product [Paramecium octaurelia]|uniref:Transmembrane protein n=1 Tax=Paramecium octaurelia TaxID=43137 RepID=A0A8S1UAR4_PAROT|nr:unnamed protein product [Paramecium octaurelia]
MNSFQIQLVLLLLFVGVQSIDQCKEYDTYQACINSDVEQCMWLNNRNLCQRTNDYLQGCSITMNKRACVKQIGNAQGQPAKCRFINVCEVIPNIKTEECLNNLSKSACIAIQNPEQICYWKDDKCQVLYQNQWSQVQKDFDSVAYSASACFLIEGYLIIHNTLLWDLISYTPNLYEEADKILKKEMGLEVGGDIVFDNPNAVSLQNNYQFQNGSYAWYTIRESKEIKLSNLYKSYRYREGCIAIEIQNDTDFLNLFRLTDQVRGINHIYCKYLNKNPSITSQFVYSDRVCKMFNKEDLNKQNKILELDLGCKSIDYFQCIYYYSNTNICRLRGQEYEYPCVNQETDYVADCLNTYCTVRQCSKQADYYMDTLTNRCSKSCSLALIKTQSSCEAIKGCKFLATSNIFFVKVCAPQNGCDQQGMQQLYCQQILDQCGWDQQYQRCYRVSEEEFKLKKCSEAFNAKSCMLVELSDQVCYWDYSRRICFNILDYPLLISHRAVSDYELYTFERYRQTISNRNFCKYLQNVSSEYLTNLGKCTIDSRTFVNDFKQINSYSCLRAQSGYCRWDSYEQICISISETEVRELNCLEQELVNEKVCQKAKTNPDMICVYDQESNSCKEITKSEFELYGCEGYGFTKNLCVSKQKLGEMCQFSAGKCRFISESYINSILCSSLQNVNAQVCQLYSSSSKVCLYDETTHSCYTPSSYAVLSYSENLNRYGCQQVEGSPTFFSSDLKKCIQLSNQNTSALSNLECTSNFVNQQTCLSIIKPDQHCFWDASSKQCKKYSGYFINCAEYEKYNPRVCAALVSDMTKQFMKDNFCVFEDNICKSKSNTITDCGESEQMNLHRCSGLTGLSQTGEYIQMCAFVNSKCKTLIDNSLNAYIYLNTISCQQANLKACTRVETNGQYCQLIDYVSSNNVVIDKKCISIVTTTETCSTIKTNYSVNVINPHHCSRASDSCQYDTTNGCISPTNTNLECNTLGLSYTGCILNTQNHRCGFINSKCQYLTQNLVVSDCKYLNQFSCSYYAFIKCYWNGSLCAASTNDTTQYGSEYNCYLNTSSTFIVSNGVTCQTIQLSNYEQYSCDSKLNQFACGSIPNQYCLFVQNKCQFYRSTLCEDSSQTCSDNNTVNLKCVYKDSKCFDHPHTYYSCDFFDKSNYLFCLQYPECAYFNQKCQKVNQISVYYQCSSLSSLQNCVLQNKQLTCSWQSGQCVVFKGTSCPSLNGFYSFNVCQKFQNCTYGFAKRGLGFCYSGNNFESLTCEQLNQDLCIEDLTHLNSSLQCYWDQSCKNVQNNHITQCTDLSSFKSSYGACNYFNQEQCMYSFIDQKCKSISEYISTTCQGTTAKQCSSIQNTCYYDGSICSAEGAQNQLNKYGCIQQSGTWKFDYFKCTQITDEVQKSCTNLSKDACLSNLTKEISCQWKDNNCQRVLQTQNKQLTSCANLNQRACQNVGLSNVFCVWNETTKNCDSLTISNTDCVAQNLAVTTSLSVCSGQTNKNCAKHYDNTKCTEINVQLSSCNLYGLNQKACIQFTSVPCQWKSINDGGYCDDANLYSAFCRDLINKYACLNVQTVGQVCKWDEITQSCIDQQISTCESASNLNSFYACNAVTDEPCQYDPISMLCSKILYIPKSCSINFNKQTCEMCLDNCVWYSNRCITTPYKNCQQYATKSKCLESESISCQWVNNICADFNDLSNKIFCKDLPLNINTAACTNNALDPCRYDKNSPACLPDQNILQYTLQKIQTLIFMQPADYKSPILSGKCEQLLIKDYCMKSRIPDTACIWKDSTCQVVTDLNEISCTDHLNIWGCLKVSKENELCFWRGQKCLRWFPTITQMENVNKNVCKYHSVNRVYERNSCIKKDISTIQCTSEGISKQTCLSITNQQCQWTDQCVEFTLSKEHQCSDFKDVSSFVCQMIPNMACVYDEENRSCVDFSNDFVGLGVSKQACIKNKRIPSHWNGNVCQEVTDKIECDSQLIVNAYTCSNQVHNTPCIYDTISNQCTSLFNAWSLKCNTEGLNFLGCVQLKQEPCIFKDNKCQLFREMQSSCMFLSQVNPKACASIQDHYCSYDQINHKCQTPQVPQVNCNIQGINKNVCIANALCMWNQDNLDCKCKSVQETEACQETNVAKCKSQSRCYFDLDQYRCVKKQCYHLKDDECDQIMDNKTCYRSVKRGCQPAVICEDIIDPKNNCTSIYINSQPCVQVGKLCVTSTNYKLLCPYSDCSNTNCILYYGTCKMRTCDDYNAQDCQKNEGCYLDQENNCLDLQRCSQITVDIYGEQVINVCNQSSVGGFKCNWQKYHLMDDTETCTNRSCEMYGASQTICQGNEINGYSCVYLNDLVCKQCEQITESCLCNQQKNVCVYKNGKCRSILCSSLLTKENCAQASDRCYWSTYEDASNVQQEACLIECEKVLNADECNSRINECYFDNQNGLCIKGKKQIPDLSSEIFIEEFYSVMLTIFICLNMIIYV